MPFEKMSSAFLSLVRDWCLPGMLLIIDSYADRLLVKLCFWELYLLFKSNNVPVPFVPTCFERDLICEYLLSSSVFVSVGPPPRFDGGMYRKFYDTSLGSHDCVSGIYENFHSSSLSSFFKVACSGCSKFSLSILLNACSTFLTAFASSETFY